MDVYICTRRAGLEEERLEYRFTDLSKAVDFAYELFAGGGYDAACVREETEEGVVEHLRLAYSVRLYTGLSGDTDSEIWQHQFADLTSARACAYELFAAGGYDAVVLREKTEDGFVERLRLEHREGVLDAGVRSRPSALASA